MERTRPEFPGAAARGRDLPMTPESAEVARVALASPGALLRGGSHERQPSAEIAEHFGVRSDMLMALRPKGDRPYLFGLHQCSRRAHVDEGRAAPFRGGRPSAHRRAGQPHRLPRPSRKRSEARGGAAACARGLVGARLRDGPRIPVRRGLPDFRRAAARAAAMARPLAEPHTSRGPGEHRGRERPGAARRSALRRRIPGGAARRCRARGAQPGRRHAGRVRPSRSPVRRDAGHHGVAAGRAGAARERSSLPHVRRPRDGRLLSAGPATQRARRQPPGLRKPRLQPGGAGRYAPPRFRCRARRASDRSPRGARQRRAEGHLRDAPSTQGRNHISGRDTHWHVQAGGAAPLPGPRARHQRAQAG